MEGGTWRWKEKKISRESCDGQREIGRKETLRHLIERKRKKERKKERKTRNCGEQTKMRKDKHCKR